MRTVSDEMALTLGAASTADDVAARIGAIYEFLPILMGRWRG